MFISKKISLEIFIPNIRSPTTKLEDLPQTTKFLTYNYAGRTTQFLYTNQRS